MLLGFSHGSRKIESPSDFWRLPENLEKGNRARNNERFRKGRNRQEMANNKTQSGLVARRELEFELQFLNQGKGVSLNAISCRGWLSAAAMHTAVN
jgi:hypothetical protein